MITKLIVVALTMAVTAGAGQWLSRPEAAPQRSRLSSLSSVIGGLHGRDLSLDDKVLRVLGVDDHVNRVYYADGPRPVPVGLYIGYYDSQRAGETIHSPMKCLPGTGWQPLETSQVDVPIPGAPQGQEQMRINRYLVQKGGDRHVVLFWYQMRGRAITSEYTAKLFMIESAVVANRTDGALVRVIVPVGSDGDEAAAQATAIRFVQHLVPQLPAFLPA